MKIVVLINRSSGELEWISPTITLLLEAGHHVDIVFLRNREYFYLKKSEKLAGLLENLGANFSVYEAFNQTDSFYFQLYNKVISRLPAHFKTCLNRKKFKIESFFNQHNIESSPDFLMIDNSFYKDLERSIEQDLHHVLFEYFNPKTILIYPHAPILNIQNKELNQFTLVDSLAMNQPVNTFYWQRYAQKAQHTYQVTDNRERTNTIVSNRGLQAFYVKSPRYQLDWIHREFKSAASSHVITKPPVHPTVLILAKSRGALFQKNPSLNALDIVKDIILMLEKHNVDWKIKPHPRDDLNSLGDLINKISKKNFAESLFEGALGKNSAIFSYCISVPTSAVLDTVLLGIPTIEYLPAKNDNIPINYDSPYQKENIVVGCNNLSDMSKLIEKFSHKKYLKETILSQQSHLNTCFNSGHDLMDVINKLNHLELRN